MNNLNRNQFCDELCEWLKERGFVNDRGWKNSKEHGMNYFSFVKNSYRFQIKLDWDKKYGENYQPIIVDFIDCTKEFWGEPYNALMWMNQNNLQKFTKPFSKTMFIELCEHYGL